MTREEAIIKLEQMYMMLSEEKKKAIDEAIKALQAQSDGDIITALCSLPKIQSEDGQDYVQLYDVFETVRRFKPQTDGDLISRQALLNAFGFSEKTRKWGGDHSGYNTMMLYEIQDVIESQPPVKPQEPKTGHWIEHPEKEISTPEYLMFYECSECGDEQCFCKSDIHKKRFCSNCGCRMVNEQESEDKE